jgi:serine/threonine protein kinase
VPILDVLHPPGEDDIMLIVMPLLRSLDSPPFDTVGEAVDFFTQIFEVRSHIFYSHVNAHYIQGMQFLHEHRIAHRSVATSFLPIFDYIMSHRDGNRNNIMMDASAMYPDMWHPNKSDRKRDFTGKAFHYTRTQKPPKYYIVDFGISRQYVADELPIQERITQGGDKSVPEHQGQATHADPFMTDVYYIGNLISTNFLKVSPAQFGYHDTHHHPRISADLALLSLWYTT